jgi:guanylate kinase
MRNIIIISGPSGCGKSTLIHRLLAEFPELAFSVSHTTRPPRPGELHGRDYHFVGRAAFDGMVRRNGFAEWAEVHGQRYGTSWREIRAKSGKKKTLVLDIDVQGARHILAQFPEAMSIFIIPPSLAELRRRLRKREAKWDAATQRRLQTAISELRAYRSYQYLIVNRELRLACAELRCLYTAHRLQMARHEQQVAKLIRGRT